MSDETPDTTAPDDVEPDDGDDGEPDDGDDGENADETGAAAEGDPAAPPAPEGMTEADIEAIGKKLDGLQKYVARKIGDILGDDAASFEECDLCSFWNTPGWRMSGPLPPDVTEALARLLGASALDDLRDDVHARACDDCAGLGQVRSGSRVASHVTLTCVTCQGRGWVATDDKRSGGFPALVNGTAALESAPMPADRLAPTPDNLSAEAEAARAQGYIVIPPAVRA